MSIYREHVNRLVNCLSQRTNIITKRKNQIVTLDAEKNVLILHQGIISSCRASDDRLLANFSAPRLFGINLFLDPSMLYFRACTDISYETMSLSEAEKTLDEQNLWKDVSINQMLTISQMLKYVNNMAGVSSYAQVIHCLYQLQSEPDIIRLHRTAADYAVDKSGLSRSTVMKLVAQFKAENKVTLRKGLLVELNNLE